MAYTNFIVPFGGTTSTSPSDSGTKGIVLTAQNWRSNTDRRPIGFKAGDFVSSITLNTAIRQATFVAAMFGDAFVANRKTAGKTTLPTLEGLTQDFTTGDNATDFNTNLTTYTELVQKQLEQILINKEELAAGVNRVKITSTSGTSAFYVLFSATSNGGGTVLSNTGLKYTPASNQLNCYAQYANNAAGTLLSQINTINSRLDALGFKTANITLNGVSLQSGQSMPVAKKLGNFVYCSWAQVITNTKNVLSQWTKGFVIGTIPTNFRPYALTLASITLYDSNNDINGAWTVRIGTNGTMTIVSRVVVTSETQYNNAMVLNFGYDTTAGNYS